MTLLFRNEDPSGVVVTDILYDRSKDLHVLGKFSAFDKSAQEIAEDPSEIFMSGIGQERAGIGKHADESGQIALCCEGTQVISDALLIIIEPPGGTMLDPHGVFTVLEASDQCVDDRIVMRVETVDDHSRKDLVIFQMTHELCQRSDKIAGAADRIKTCVCTKCTELAGIVITTAAEVDLHRPASGIILCCQEQKKCTLIDSDLMIG